MNNGEITNTISVIKSLTFVVLPIVVVMIGLSAYATSTADNKTAPGIISSVLLFVLLVVSVAIWKKIKLKQDTLSKMFKCDSIDGTYKTGVLGKDQQEVLVIVKDLRYTIQCKDQQDITGSVIPNIFYGSDTNNGILELPIAKLSIDKDMKLCNKVQVIGMDLYQSKFIMMDLRTETNGQWIQKFDKV